MRGCITVIEYHLNTTTICIALVVQSFGCVEHCSNAHREVLSGWIPTISKTCYPLTIMVMSRFNCISCCVSSSLSASWLFFLMNASDWQHLSERVLCTLALSPPCHTTPQLAFLAPVSLAFPMQVQFQAFHKHWEGGHTEERKKNSGCVFCKDVPAASQCGLCVAAIYYNNKIHKLMPYYLKMWIAFSHYRGHFLYWPLK